MQTILAIIKIAGGWHPGLNLKIDNPPYMELVIEAMEEFGPMGLPALSVAHYGEQNGDLMRVVELRSPPMPNDKQLTYSGFVQLSGISSARI
jgi:hypothetical protein